MPPTSAAARRTVAGVSSFWCMKNQSVSLSNVPRLWAITAAAAASHAAGCAWLVTPGLHFGSSGKCLSVKLTSCGRSLYFATTGS